MKIGVVHYNFPGYSLTDFLGYTRDTGYGYVELQISDVWGQGVDDPEKEAEKVKGLVDSYGVKVSALSAGNDFIQLEAEAVKAQADRMKTVCQLARILGTNTIRTEGGAPKDSVPEEKWVEAMAGCLTQCLEFVEKDDIYLAVDNHGVVTNDGDLQVELFEKVGSKHVGANLDTMNYRWFGHDLETIGRYYEIVAPYTLHTHLKDGTGCRSEYQGAALGEGEIDLKKAIERLRNAGYDGVWCVEYEGKEHDGVGTTKCFKWLEANL